MPNSISVRWMSLLPVRSVLAIFFGLFFAISANAADSDLADARPAPRPENEITDITPLSMPSPAAIDAELEGARISAIVPSPVSAGNSILDLETGDGVVGQTGATLFGLVMAGSGFDVVDVTVLPTGRTARVDVGQKTRKFAVRLFESDFADSVDIEIVLTARSAKNPNHLSEAFTFNVTAAPVADGVAQAMSRLTFGGNAELYFSLQDIGFERFVEEQLADSEIANSNFEALGADRILDFSEERFWPFSTDVLGHQLTYAVFSEKQLREVMTLFWANHFHAAYKDSSRIHLRMYDDRAFYRDNAFGRFKDLLIYSARSPLMSQFLDNDESSVGSLNENYARELLELHTMSSEGGYSEKDVAEVARVFTGWHYAEVEQDDADEVARFEFLYRPLRHDEGDKIFSFYPEPIVGRNGAEGYQEGRELLVFLAEHPATIKHVCGKIVQLLVADTPPDHFVKLCDITWKVTDGNIRAILESILKDPAYIQTVEYQRNKGKTPFEFAASAARFLGLDPAASEVEPLSELLVKIVRDGGMFPVTMRVPTGEPEDLDAWNTTASKQAIYQVAVNQFGSENRYGFKTTKFIYQNSLETAEIVAAYLLSIATGDRYRQAEFDHIVALLKGDDGEFQPLEQNEADQVRLAWRAVLVMPSFQLQ